MKYDFYIKSNQDNSIIKGKSVEFEWMKKMLFKMEYAYLGNIKKGTASTGKAKRNKKSIDKNKITR